MLIENTLFGKINKVDQAIAKIRLHEPANGYYVAFSGGKDSCVILDLIQRAGVKYDAHYNVTTVEPPELLKFVHDYHSNIIIEKPEMPMYKLIEKKGVLPTRLIRYCCAVYKERGGIGRTVVTGVRKAESNSRSKWSMVAPCNKHNNKQFLHPIIDWSTEDVWEYIKTYNLPYCELYDKGWDRIGCVGCPFASTRQRKRDLAQYPHIEKMWKYGCQKIIDKRKAAGKEAIFKTAEDMYEWWLSGKGMSTAKPDEINLFGILTDEGST